MRDGIVFKVLQIAIHILHMRNALYQLLIMGQRMNLWQKYNVLYIRTF